jgi:hypothetical protein
MKRFYVPGSLVSIVRTDPFTVGRRPAPGGVQAAAGTAARADRGTHAGVLSVLPAPGADQSPGSAAPARIPVRFVMNRRRQFQTRAEFNAHTAACGCGVPGVARSRAKGGLARVGSAPGAIRIGATFAPTSSPVTEQTLRGPGKRWHGNTFPSSSTSRVQRLSSTAVYPAARRTTSQPKRRLLAANCGIHC